MKIIDELIELLSSDQASLTGALIKAQVLAHKLGERDLSQWVVHELRGYPKGAEVPDYRILRLVVRGTISNGFYRHNDIPLPIMHLDESVRKSIERKVLLDSISVIEEWAKREEELSSVIPPELFPLINKGLDSDFYLEKARGQLVVGAAAQVVAEVRSRLLEFILALSDCLPADDGHTELKSAAGSVDAAGLFHSSIFGDNTTIIVGSGNTQNVTNKISRNDIESLTAFLRKQKVSESDISDLKSAVAADADTPEVKDSRLLGPAVCAWISSMTAKAGTAAWQVSVSAAGTLLSEALRQFYGLPR